MNIVLATEMSLFTLILIIAVIILLAFAALLFFLFKFRSEANRIRYNRNYRKNCYYLIDIKSQSVVRYNFKNLSNVKEMSYTKFLSSFNDLDTDRFKNWIVQLFDDEEIDYKRKDYVNLFTFKVNRSKSSYNKIVFQVKYIEKAVGIVYLETTVLSNLPVVYTRNKRSIVKAFQSKGEIKKIYEDGFFGRGYYLSLRISKTDNSTSRNDFVTGYILLDSLYSVLNSTTAHYYVKDDKFIDISILDRHYVQQNDLVKIVEKINKKITETFELYGFFNMYQTSLIGAEVSDLSHDFDDMEKTIDTELKKMSGSVNNASIYQKNVEKENILAIKAEIIKVSRTKQIDVSYQPIIKYANDEITNYGYLVDFKVHSQSFDEIDSLKKKALQYGVLKDVLGVMLNKALPLYREEKENYYSKVFVPLSLHDINLVNKILPNIIKKDVGYNIVCLFDLIEFNDIDDYEPYFKLFKTLQLQGYEIALRVKVNDFVMKKELFDAVDIILINSEFENNLKAESKSFIRAHTVFDRVFQLSKTIIAINLNSMVEVELLYKSGLQYFVGNAIAEPASEIVPLDKKVLKKLTNFNN